MKQIFSELDELDLHEEEWVERGRWIVYEQIYEEADRWSNPHVSSLSFHSVAVLRKCIEYGLYLTVRALLPLPGSAQCNGINIIIIISKESSIL